eukprot:933989_1
MIRITITDDIQIRARASTTYDELIALVVKNIKHREKRIQQKKERAAARLRNVENEEVMNEEQEVKEEDKEEDVQSHTAAGVHRLISNNRPSRSKATPAADNYQITCYRCGEKGHMARECKAEKLCYNCGQSGHIARDCPTGRGAVYQVAQYEQEEEQYYEEEEEEELAHAVLAVQEIKSDKKRVYYEMNLSDGTEEELVEPVLTPSCKASTTRLEVMQLPHGRIEFSMVVFEDCHRSRSCSKFPCFANESSQSHLLTVNCFCFD